MWPDARTRRRWALLPLLALWGLLHGSAATALSPAMVLFLPADRVLRLIEAVPELAQAIKESAPPL